MRAARGAPILGFTCGRPPPTASPATEGLSMDDPGVVIVDLGPYQRADSDAVRRLQKGARAPIIVLSGQVSGAGRAQPVRIGDTMIDLTAKRITRRRPGAGEEVRLTPTEWHLLEVLLRSPGRLLSRQQILAAVWGPGYDRAAGNLRLYMTQLRRKLEPDPARPPLPGAAPRITRLA
jgi:hypothetical protein